MKKKVLKRHLLASVGLVSLMAAGPASAADIAPPLKAPPPISSWAGLYLGVHAGYGWGNDPFDTVFSGKAPLLGFKSKGGVWGFHAGANWQDGALVGGIEIDMSATGIKGTSLPSTTTIAVGGDTASSTIVQRDKFDYLGSARARLGYLVSPNLLIYGTGGLAWTRFVQTQDQSISINAPPTVVSLVATQSTPSWRFGFAVGAGVEAKLWDSNWLARVEYLHYDFGNSGSNSSSFEGILNNSFTSGHLTADVVRAGLSYKFQRDPGVMVAGYPGMSVKGMPVKAPRAAPVLWSWSGFYLGAHAGYGWGRDPFSDPRGDFVLTDINSKGFVGGFHAGGNWQSGAWVGGLEIDLSGTGIKGSTTGSASFGGGDFSSATRSDKFDLLGSARTRIGFLPWPNVLVYGTGGLAWTRFVQTEVDSSSFGGSPSSSTSEVPTWRFGWVAGGGVESRLWESNWLARVEYLHYDFGDSESSSFSGGPGLTTGPLTVDVVRAGVSYKFGQDQVAAVAPMPVKAPQAVAGPWSWSGYYLGGHAGYGWGRDPRSDTVFGSKAPEPLSVTLFSDINSRGFVGGFQAGGNWQMGSWVAGLEIDLSGTGIRGSTTSTALDGSATETLTEKFKLLGSARARLGSVFLWPSVLLYGTGGLAWTRLQLEDFTTNFPSGSTSLFTSPAWKFGWVAGVGGEARLWNTNWLVRLEYLHYDFGNSSEFAQSIVGTTPTPINLSISQTSGRLTADVVRTGLSFKLD